MFVHHFNKLCFDDWSESEGMIAAQCLVNNFVCGREVKLIKGHLTIEYAIQKLCSLYCLYV